MELIPTTFAELLRGRAAALGVAPGPTALARYLTDNGLTCDRRRAHQWLQGRSAPVGEAEEALHRILELTTDTDRALAYRLANAQRGAS